jgi:hypothetical protein
MAYAIVWIKYHTNQMSIPVANIVHTKTHHVGAIYNKA